MIQTKRALLTAVIGAMAALSALAAGPAWTTSVRVEELHPFTHSALIPAGADLSSIRFADIRKVNVATRRETTIDSRYCADAAFREPGGSMYCAYSKLKAFVLAYQVTFSYRDLPMTSDEYGSRYFTFDVYLRPDELGRAAIGTLARHHVPRSEVAALFDLTTYGPSVQEAVTDMAASAFCDGNYAEGAWILKTAGCKDRIRDKTVAVPSNYVTVKVDPA